MKKRKNKSGREVVKTNRLDFFKMASLYSFLTIFVVVSLVFLSSSFTKEDARRVGVKHEGVVTLPETALSVEIASTKEEVEQGLSGRLSMDEKEGMLFVFPSMGQYAFWMKDMKFPLDMVWISDEGRVTYIAENVATSTYPKKTFKNEAYAKYVLEMKAGAASKYGLYLGTSVGLPSSLFKTDTK